MNRMIPATRRSSWLTTALLPCAVALLLPVAGVAQTLPTAQQVASQIAVGWNVGNSLEATGGETAWGNPLINPQLVNAVRAAGFNAVRIPCAWDGHADQTTMTIDPAWLARVKQVVDYAIGNGMYVVLNEHWDGGWLEEHPLYSYQTSVNAKHKAYWTQIANYFKSYDQHLLFAGTNEVHADYNTPTTENITVQQSYNQTFVSAVRATGGNNATRTLVVQTYNTNIQHGLNYFTPPTDTTSGRLIVEVHFYDPYDYTLNSSGSCLYWGAPYPTQSACTWAQESYVDSTFAQVKSKWVNAGYPVIIGEYGVATRGGLDLASRQYYLKYVNQAAVRNGIKTFYWDNGVQGNNGFALFDRSSGAVVDAGALKAVLDGAGVTPGSGYPLTVTRAGTGSGTVTASAGGIDCGSVCSATIASGTAVTLTAAAAAGSTFAGWSGACTGSGSCIVSMTAARSAAATFDATQQGGAISINAGGGAAGTFLADVDFSGGSTYSSTRTIDTSLLTGTVPPASLFQTERYGEFTYTIPGLTAGGAYAVTLYFAETYWTAAGQRTFNVAINGAAVLTAFDIFATAGGASRAIARTFNTTASASGQVIIAFTRGGGLDNPKLSGLTLGGTSVGTGYTLTVSKSGAGSGTVAGGGITCGSICTATGVPGGTTATLTATPAVGSSFAGWSGACTGTGTCVVTATANLSVTATFDASGGTGTCKAVSGGQSGNFNTAGAICFTVTGTLNGWGCSNVDGRTVTVNGTATACGKTPLPGGSPYTFSFTAGSYTWASFYWW